jgi:hypothetical protein
MRGCVRTLEAGARRLLSLRAGLVGPARSPVATARILRVSLAREERLERRAVRALRRSAVTGCAAPAAPLPSGSTAAAAPTSASASGAAAPSGPSATLSAAHAERSPRTGRQAVPVHPPTGVDRAQTGASSLGGVIFAALLALLLGLVLLALPETRRRLAGAGHGGDPLPRPARPASPSRPPAPGPAPTARPQPARTGPSRSTKFDEKLALMAAEVFVAMTRGPADDITQPEDQGQDPDPHSQVEPQLPREREIKRHRSPRQAADDGGGPDRAGG